MTTKTRRPAPAVTVSMRIPAAERDELARRAGPLGVSAYLRDLIASHLVDGPSGAARPPATDRPATYADLLRATWAAMTFLSSSDDDESSSAAALLDLLGASADYLPIGPPHQKGRTRT